tara:strand:- start:71 stop:547 length:477 start_codon:yes stop_codon:yes gene_type:complete
MICGTTCIIAFVFLIANLYTILSCSNSKELKKNFLNVLNDEQKLTYGKIINERKNIYYCGYILGIILSIIGYLIIKKFTKISFNKMSLICFVGAITFVTNYLFYILYPKSDYMLLHLNDKKQIQEWLKIYRTMQFKLHLGFVFGIIAVMIFCSSFDKI